MLDIDTARKLVTDLLKSYGEVVLIENYSIDGVCMPLFTRGLFAFAVYVNRSTWLWKTTKPELKGHSVLDVASLIYKAFKDGAWLEADITTSAFGESPARKDKVKVLPSDLAACKFMVNYDLLSRR